MKDILASQNVLRRRRRPSLLSSASEARAALEKRRVKPRPLRAALFAAKSRGAPGLPGARKHFFAFAGAAAALVLAVFISIEYFIPAPEPPGDSGPGRLASASGLWNGGPVPEGVHSDEIPLELIETFAWQDYTVAPGDTVEKIARNFSLSLDAVIASNGIGNVRRGLRSGSTIRIPNMDGIPYTVKKGDSYRKIADSFKVPLEAILDANDVQSSGISAGTVLFIPGAKMKKEELRLALGDVFIYPVRGRLTSGFGWRTDPFTRTMLPHTGIDLSSPHGAPVKAAAPGRVSSTGYNAIYGNFIVISHDNTYQTMYGHLSKISVSRGSYVSQGAVIGLVGSTGRSTGAHLHFMVYKNGRAINPLEILNK